MTGYRGFALLYALCFAPTCTAGLFDNQEQQAEKLFKQDEFEAAAETFTDSYRRGVAQYRAGQYGQAAESFHRVQRESVKTDALYNLGNSRFQEGKLEAAAEAYRQVLLLEPDYEDARHNLGLTSAMLAEMSEEEQLDPDNKDETEKQDEEEQKEQEEQQQKEKKEQEDKQQSSEDQQQQQEQEKEEQNSGGEQKEQQQSSGDQDQQEQQSSSGEQSDQQQQSGDEQSEQQESSGDQDQQEQQSSSGEQSNQQQQSGDEQSEQQQSSGDKEKQEQQSSALKGADQQRGGEDNELEKQGRTGNESTEQQSGGSEQAVEDGQSGDQQAGKDTEGSSGNEHLDNADAASTDSGDEEREAGGRTAGSRQQAGVANDPRDFDPARANMNMGAIEQFDQLGSEVESEGEDAGLPGEMSGTSGNSTVTLMDQLLDQVEGDPVNLMRNQFRLEEQRMNRTGGQLYEPRPW